MQPSQQSQQQQRPPSRGVAVSGLKLPFVVAYASSSAEGFEASQLEPAAREKAASASTNDKEHKEEKQTTHIKGWQSAKWCTYPQILVLRFPQVYDIRKIQILAHQSKIAHTIELYSGLTSSPAPPSSSSSAPSSSTTTDPSSLGAFTRLGYLSLDSNERSNFKARELKSVYVHARGNMLQLLIKKCYTNALNTANQVGIIAINVVGTAVDPREADEAIKTAEQQQRSHPSQSQPSSHPHQSSSSLSSLMSQYQCDEKTAHQMLELEQAKHAAITVEDYDEAKRLKLQLDGLKERAGRIAQLEKEKKEAVANEDYDRAKQLKKEIDYLRSGEQPPPQQPHHQHPPHSHRGHDRHGSEEGGAYGGGFGRHAPPPPAAGKGAGQRRGMQHDEYGYDEPQQPPSHRGHPHPHHPPPPPDQYDEPPYDEYGEPDGEHPDGDRMHPPPQHHPSHRGPPPPEDEGFGHGHAPPQQPPAAAEEEPIHSSYAPDPMDRPIRPSRNAAMMPPEEEHPASHNEPFAEDGAPAPEPLTAGNRKEAEPLIDVFGEHTVLCLFSKHWSLRQQALKDITQSVVDHASGAWAPEMPAKDLFSFVARVLRKGLSDKVSAIFLSAAQLMQVMLQNLAMKCRPEEVKQMLEPCVQAMLDKLSSPNVRERDGAMQVLTFLAFDSHVHPSLVPSALLQPLKKKEKDNPLPLKMRSKLLLKCVIFYGLDEGFGLGSGNIIKFLYPHLIHRDGGVRDGMFNLAAGVSSIVGAQKLLQALSLHAKELRPQTQDTLHQKLEDVAAGVMIFVKPTQPSLDQPYISENDPTHIMQGAEGHNTSGSGFTAGGRHGGGGKAAGGGGGGGKQKASPQRNQPPPPPPQQPIYDPGVIPEEETSLDLQGKCQFCGLEDPTFTEDKLDLHYWQDCPLLICCQQCGQVIEIPTLNEHLLLECEVQGAFKECQTCKQPILAAAYQQHVDMADCQPPAPGMSRCALCQSDVEKSDEGWRQHLLVDTCPNNKRSPIKT